MCTYKIPLIYVAGPFTADNAWLVERNVRRAEEFGFELMRRGALPIIPHCNTRFFFGAVNEKVALEGYKKLLTVCDAVAVTNSDWKASSGTVSEVTLAFKMRKPLFFSNTESELLKLCSWIDEFIVGF